MDGPQKGISLGKKEDFLTINFFFQLDLIVSHLDGLLETQHLAKKRSKCQNWKNPKILRFDDDDYFED